MMVHHMFLVSLKRREEVLFQIRIVVLLRILLFQEEAPYSANKSKQKREKFQNQQIHLIL